MYPSADRPANRARLAEAVAVWAMFGVVAVAIFVTYSWLPQEDSYNFDTTGIGGGLGRAFVFLAFPTSLVAIPIALLAAAALGTRRLWIGAGLAIALSLTVVLPGNLDQNDLDPKPFNAVTVAGVALAVFLTVAAWRTGASLRWGRVPGDHIRVAIAVVLLAGSVPWLLAEIGIYTDDASVLGLLFTSDERGPPGEPVAVHLGHHHGLDGTLLAIAALLLTRPVQRMAKGRLRRILAAYLSLLFVYGVGNAVQDFWLEQFVKRGWLEWEIPTMLRPGIEPIWAVVVLAGIAVYVAFVRFSSRASSAPT